VAPERWHVTLAFLGELRAGQRHRLDERLRELATTIAPFRLTVAGSGAFPSPSSPRVLWVGLGGELDALAQLAVGVRRAARAARIELDGKPFRAHVTAARVRHQLDAHDVPHILRKLSAADGGSWEVDRIALMHSTLGPQPRYDELQSWELTSPI
jgi:2'-5' RNA ligase